VNKEINVMSEKLEKQKTAKKLHRYSVSVSGKTYDRLRVTVTSGSLASFVDEIIASALDEPTILARIVVQCRQETTA
jgi:hypothetical protein